MAAHPHHHHWTLEQYVAHERDMGLRHEYIDGQIYAMSGGTIRHGRISGNIFGILFVRLQGKSCVPYNSDVGISAQKRRKYFYPDVSVVCGELVIDPALSERIANPTVLFEVLSDGTEDYDRTTKFGYYKLISSLRDYVIVEQERVSVTHYTRVDEAWSSAMLTQRDDTISLPSLGITLALADMYEGVTWDGIL